MRTKEEIRRFREEFKVNGETSRMSRRIFSVLYCSVVVAALALACLMVARVIDFILGVLK